MKRKHCTRCSEEFDPSGPNQKRCKSCRKAYDKEIMAEIHRQTYVKKGYSQKGASNNNWKGGIATYRELIEKTACAECGKGESLLVHHVDGDRYNNNTSNLETLCKRHHQIRHECAKNLPCPKEVGRKRKEWIKRNSKEVIRDRKGRFKTLP